MRRDEETPTATSRDGEETCGHGGKSSVLPDVVLPMRGEQAPYLSDEREIGALPGSDWLMPKKQLLWMSGGRTVGSTHYDPYENLMAVIGGNKTFYLAQPGMGEQVGGFSRMVEEHFTLDGQSQLLRRPAAGVPSVTELHHYAMASLGTPASEQPRLSRMAEVDVVECVGRAGDVIFTPSYWWHEVFSQSDERSGLSIGLNWFFESFYQRIYPNMSWDRSPHYMLSANRQASYDHLRRPFPRRSSSPPTDQSALQQKENKPIARQFPASGASAPETSGGAAVGVGGARYGGTEQAEASPRAGRARRSSFADRLRERTTPGAEDSREL